MNMKSSRAVGNWEMLEARSRPGSEKAAGESNRWPAWPIVLLVVALVVPWQVTVGPIDLSMHRIALIVLAVPCLASWGSGKAGPIRVPDLLLIFYCMWCSIALIAVHGANAVGSGGVLFAETFISYLVGRCYVRSAADFRASVRVLFLVVSAMLPFAIVETVTGNKAMLDLFATVLPTVAPTVTELRLGFMRVQGPFDHPILFGVFCGGIVAITHGVLGRDTSFARRWVMTLIVVATGMMSWSSGPLLSIGLQIALLAWSFIFRNIAARWRILWAIAFFAYLVLEVASNQPVPQLLTRFAFDPWTAYYRLLIWNYGWDSISLHPLFGTGFGEWVRPAWMPPSIDMFWIVPAIRHGLPAFISLLTAVVWLLVSIGLSSTDDRKTADYKTAYLISITSFIVAGFSVHFWNSTYVLFLFLLGSGMWMLDAETATRTGNETRQRRRHLELSRSPGPRPTIQQKRV
ncbi:O-antigen ligase domain-containing protein [Devosia sp. YIM 151766]|uniref:O-antigen ligase family protein n=1 Tax=Devosia sp. YIM 151766 TaxID=3017325 RepID=UPI00255C4DF4|nr:O-antigen ligase domain-containing protein [Devosia sp. YIM 151766]WIY54207.1 O-antigen ligase domain-containing protein [Devosia sp. YIM 151766]